MDLRGKGALIAGTRRIGAVVARRLARESVNLAIAYRSSRKEAEELREEVAGLTERACVLRGDLSVEADVRRLVDGAARELGDLSFAVNLASEFPAAAVESLDGAAWDGAMAMARGSYLLAAHASRRMLDNPGPTRGHIILFGDWAAAETPYRGHLPYLTAKAAIEFMTRAFAAELAPRGILVNAIAPGPTMRPPEIDPEIWNRDVIGRTPLRRQSSAEDIVELIAALLRCETVTGECIRVDSGRHLAGPGAAD
jgi:NAD(P)-dependent dehydrogenase (short-subunit alcohol dehydrogenase family)